MQIRSHTSSHNCPCPNSRFNGDIYTYKSTNSRVLRLSGTLAEDPATPKAILPIIQRTQTINNPANSWSDRVQGLFDPALRDAEDMMLSLPYADIRQKIYHLAKALDEQATSGSEGTLNRHLPGSRTSTKAKRTRTASSITYAAAEGGNGTQTSRGPSTHYLATRTLPGQDYDASMLTKAMCVT